jgi:hypothetical protein
VKDIGLVVGLIALVSALLVLYVLVVQWAWNTLVPAIFGGPTIDIQQAVAVCILLSLVSGGTRYVRDR